MSYNNKLNNYLERLHINKKYKNIYTQSNNIKWVRKIINNYEINNIKNGGKVYEHKYLDLLFKFYIVDNDTSFSFTLHQKNNEDLIECIHVIIDKENGGSQIQYIGEDKTCYTKGQYEYFLSNNIKTGGTLLLKIALHLIDKLKEKFKIKYIMLTDNSKIYCNRIKKDIELPLMTTLLYGHTWYSL